MDNYWRDREEQAKAEYALTEEQYVERLNGIYDYMLDQVKKEINGFYSKYMRAENITYAEATQRVENLDIEEYERKAAKYVKEKDFSKKANEEMRLYNLTMKVNRLELLKANIGLEMVSSFDELNDLFEEGLTEEALSEFRRQAGILGKTVQDNAKAASTIANASFHNATFSDRIWMYQGMLRNELDTLLRQGLIQGRSSVELARYLDRSFDAGRYNAERLMRTEMSRVLAEAQAESFIANGFDEYEFMALGTACEVCKAIDGQHFKVADRMPGENCPPMHPNCKCTITSWDDDELYQEWLNSYKDHGMDYDTWLANRPTAVDQTATFNGEYLRFGEIPEDEQSVNFTKLTFDESRRVGNWNFTVPEEAKESGVSVFRLDQDGSPIIDNIDLAKDLAGRMGEENAYIVSGDIVGIGQDGEPLLSNVTIKKEGGPSKSKLIGAVDKFLRSEFETIEEYEFDGDDDYSLSIFYTSYYENPETGEVLSEEETGFSQPKGWINLGQRMEVLFAGHRYLNSVHGPYYRY